MAAANQSTRGSVGGDAVREKREYKEAQDYHQSELVVTLAKYRQLEHELDVVTAERDVLKADLCAFAVDMEKQLAASQLEARRLREALDAIMESAKVAYCATTDPMMTDELVGICKRCKDAIEND